jgi:hypothetical protein
VLARLRQLPALLLDFVEQPHVLNGDDRLVGEGSNLTSSTCHKSISPRRWSSKRRPQTCCKSYPARPATCGRCSKPCWRTRQGSVGPDLALCTSVRARTSV